MPISSNSTLNEILIEARQANATDVHICAQKPIIFRQLSQLKNLTNEPMPHDRIRAILTEALPADVIKQIETTGDAEYVYTIPGHGRFRTAIIKQRNGWDITARLIATQIPSFESTGMTQACANLTKWAQGMVLITGPAGCGKSTSLSALVDMINQNRHDHIITIEQPIEIVYEPKNCQITQREIGMHTASKENALRAALREDPDILVVSELRDWNTISLAISAAETGHLVFGTMNTINAAQTISRLIDSFPAEEQPVIRNMISESLRGVICQQLIPRKDGNGMVAAYEILIITPSVANLIREGKIGQINNAMTTGKSFGMMLMDFSLEHLVNTGVISVEEACDRATNPTTLMQLINR